MTYHCGRCDAVRGFEYAGQFRERNGRLNEWFRCLACGWLWLVVTG